MNGSFFCSYGFGNRIKLPYTRKIIDAIHSGSLLNAIYRKTEVFGLDIPTEIEGVPSEILHPVNTVIHHPSLPLFFLKIHLDYWLFPGFFWCSGLIRRHTRKPCWNWLGCSRRTLTPLLITRLGKTTSWQRKSWRLVQTSNFWTNEKSKGRRRRNYYGFLQICRKVNECDRNKSVCVCW